MIPNNDDALVEAEYRAKVETYLQALRLGRTMGLTKLQLEVCGGLDLYRKERAALTAHRNYKGEGNP